jgi:ABC-2 type transport system ATP-binding protein
MIQLENISKAFRDNLIFEKVNLAVEDGEKVFIRGINGSGKSILLKIIVGFSKPTTGNVVVDNYQIGKDRDFIPDAGISINTPQFMNNWTGLENLSYLASINGKASKEKIIQLANKLSLEQDLSKKYKIYSLGMRQKMRIIQALMEEPRYLILDEPFDALDKGSKEMVLQLLEEFLKEDPKRSLIFTSHNDRMEEFATRIYEINNRQLEEVSLGDG